MHLIEKILEKTKKFDFKLKSYLLFVVAAVAVVPATAPAHNLLDWLDTEYAVCQLKFMTRNKILSGIFIQPQRN